ncbi:MAG TPA: MoaD/ThiS family protein [Streptosporangiaceae bacterium]|jgi:molybdopterin synthase sulfur carrier subunit|nr:MoaD/ThiS family protein [Streptosporangiaceae bacterium]
MAIVTMRYWAAAKDAAGVAEQQLTADTLATALVAAAGINGGAQLRAVLDRSSFLIDGSPVGRRAADSVVLADGNVIEVLPPFAGG